MTGSMLARLVDCHRWANLVLLRACSGLRDEQLDATPRSPKEWSIRQVLLHLVESERGYLSLLADGAPDDVPDVGTFDGLTKAATRCGEGLRAIADDAAALLERQAIRTRDEYMVEPWVVLVQALGHGVDHRRQVCGILRALGVEPPRLDGWAFGEAVGAVVGRGS